MSEKQLFEERADATLDKVRELYSTRGKQYSDSWGECSWNYLKATLKLLFPDREFTDLELQAVGFASFCDQKYWRTGGGYKLDHLHDGIAFTAAYADTMERLYEERIEDGEFGS